MHFENTIFKITIKCLVKYMKNVVCQLYKIIVSVKIMKKKRNIKFQSANNCNSKSRNLRFYGGRSYYSSHPIHIHSAKNIRISSVLLISK